jgi:hypothetical protein
LRDDQADVIFRGQFGAMTQNEALDISVLGRDITNVFAVIADRRGNVVVYPSAASICGRVTPL